MKKRFLLLVLVAQLFSVLAIVPQSKIHEKMPSVSNQETRKSDVTDKSTAQKLGMIKKVGSPLRSNPFEDLSKVGKIAWSYLLYDDVYNENQQIMNFDITNPKKINLKYTQFNTNACAGAYANESYYLYFYRVAFGIYYPISFCKFNLDNGSFDIINDYYYSDMFTILTDMSFDNTTNTMFAVTHNTGREAKFSNLMTVNLQTGLYTQVAKLDKYFWTLACNQDGQLYGISYEGDFYKINKITGRIDRIGATGEKPNYFQSMDFDRDNNTLYWTGSSSNDEGFLATINLTTGKATRVGTLGSNAEAIGLHIPYTLAAGNAPHAVNVLEVIPNKDGASSVVLSWNNPTKTNDGNTLTSMTGIDIYRNGGKIHSITSTTMGKHETWTDNSAVTGFSIYRVVPKNSIGDGVPSAKTVYVGKDKPGKVESLKMIASENKTSATLSWNEPSVGINTGWFDKASLKYRIVRMPDNKVVSNACTETTFVDNNVTILGRYSYVITAYNSDGNGGVVESNSDILGYGVITPYSCSFNTEETRKLWTIINNNNDRCTWGVGSIPTSWGNSEDCMAYQFSIFNADDWLISPPMQLEAGKTYKISATFQTDGTDEKVKITIGKNNAVEAQTKILGTHILNGSSDILVESIATIDDAGNYNIGIQECSELLKNWVYLKGVTVEYIPDYELQALSIEGYKKPVQGKEYSYKVAVVNNGVKAQSNVKVQLIDKSDTILAEKTIEEDIASGETKNVEVKWTPATEHIGSMQIRGKVIGNSADSNPQNNISNTLDIDVTDPADNEWIVISPDDVENRASNVLFDFTKDASIAQNLYLAEELNIEGAVILALEYSWTYNMNITNKPVKIWIANTDINSLEDGWLPQNEFTLVYDGRLTLPTDKYSIKIDLQSPYFYNGKNVCIMTERTNDGNVINIGPYFHTSRDMDDSRVRVRYHGGSGFDFSQSGSISNDVTDVSLLAETIKGTQIKGKITDGTTAIEGVNIKVKTEGLNEINILSDIEGKYCVGYVPLGKYTFTLTKKGFQDITEEVNVESIENIITKDIIMTTIPKSEVTGRVIDSDGAIAGANVYITGYSEYSGVTNELGEFKIENVFFNSNYLLKVEKSRYVKHERSIIIDNAKCNVGDIILEDDIKKPAAVYADASDGNMQISWVDDSDVSEFRYDNGVISDQLGIPYAFFRAVFGSIHKQPSKLINMSWVTVADESDPMAVHKTVDVYVFDLNQYGRPTKNILFSQIGVKNTDNQWSSFKFPLPVECPNGFMIAIGSAGFIGIGLDDGQSKEFPFKLNTHYYSGDYETIEFSLLESIQRYNNFMLRAEGQLITDVDDAKTSAYGEPAKALKGYKVWRLKSGEESQTDRWIEVNSSPVNGSSIIDEEWGNVEAGTYRYAVKSSYSDGISSEVTFSNIISRNAKVIVNVETDTPTNEAIGAIVKLTNVNSTFKATVESSGKATFEGIPNSVFEMQIEKEGFEKITETKDFSGQNLWEIGPYTLREIKVNPFNLEIVNTSEASSKIMNWNVYNELNDDFERHEDFKINSPGELKWSYIDGDNSTTHRFEATTFPGSSEKMAYIVFNPDMTTGPLTNYKEFTAHSGQKYLACFSAVNGPNDDYVISPSLSFREDFTLTFFAKTANDYYGKELMQVGYSTKGIKKSDFKWLNTTPIQVPSAEWAEYEFTIPAAAKHVAVRSVTNQGFVFMIDDISIHSKKTRALTTFEVYLDDASLGTTKSNTYTLTSLSKGSHVAGVKAIYSSGETAISKINFNVDDVGVNSILNGELKITNPITTELRIMNAENIDRIEIYDESGKLILSEVKPNDFETYTINCTYFKNGIYILRAFMGEEVSTCKFIKNN